MNALLIISVVVIGYVIPAIYAWRLTREMHIKVWKNIQTSGWDIFFVVFPMANLIVCLDAMINLRPKKAGKTFSQKFFRL